MRGSIPLLLRAFLYCGTKFITEYIFFMDQVYLLTRLWDGRSNSGSGSEIFLLFQTSRHSGAHPAANSIGNWTILWEKDGRDVKLTPHLHLEQRFHIMARDSKCNFFCHVDHSLSKF